MKKLGLLIAFLSITLIIGCGDTASSEESPIGDEQGDRPAAGRHQRLPLHPPGRRPLPGHPHLHPHQHQRQR